MNKSGCKDPVAETAVHNETERERLRRKYKIREGDVARMRLPTRDEERKGPVYKIVPVRLKEIHTHLVTVILPSGLLESFTWWRFRQQRR